VSARRGAPRRGRGHEAGTAAARARSVQRCRHSSAAPLPPWTTHRPSPRPPATPHPHPNPPSYTLEVGPRLMDFLVHEGNSAEYGVRPLRRVRWPRGRACHGALLLRAMGPAPALAQPAPPLASWVPRWTRCPPHDSLHTHPLRDPAPTPAPHPQAITSFVDDVLADAVLHGRVPKGGTAFIELDPATNTAVVWPGRPAPADLLSPPLDARTEAAHTVGADDDGLMPSPGGPGGPFPGGAGAGAEAGGAGAGSVYVLASGGFDDA
jgi:hypothetical protein